MNCLTGIPDDRYTHLKYEGHVHDKKICDEEPLLLPKGIRLWQDTGFIGHRPDGIEVYMPKKKPKGRGLTPTEKQENKRISGTRVKVGHAIGGMKKCRIVKERFRCHKFGFEDMVALIACGLHNFRISNKMNYINNLIYMMSIKQQNKHTVLTENIYYKNNMQYNTTIIITKR